MDLPWVLDWYWTLRPRVGLRPIGPSAGGQHRWTPSTCNFAQAAIAATCKRFSLVILLVTACISAALGPSPFLLHLTWMAMNSWREILNQNSPLPMHSPPQFQPRITFTFLNCHPRACHDHITYSMLLRAPPATSCCPLPSPPPCPAVKLTSRTARAGWGGAAPPVSPGSSPGARAAW